jgi:dGTP triphosphohydrolase
MKGKKKDLSFINSFIEDCINNSITNAEDIANLALEEISIIDEQIKKIEYLKEKRCKLLDVIEMFDKKEKNFILDMKILRLHSVHNKNIAKLICSSLLKSQCLNISNLFNLSKKQDDIIFTIKELIENDIIIKNDESIFQGAMFNDYLKHVIKQPI